MGGRVFYRRREYILDIPFSCGLRNIEDKEEPECTTDPGTSSFEELVVKEE